VIVRRLLLLVCLLAGAASAALAAGASQPAGGVVVVPIHGTIDAGMAHLVERAVADAKEHHARAIVLDVNTFGGLVASGTEIRDALLASEVPVDAYVTRAWSAGALVTLAASHIAMAPAASIGDALPINPTNAKTISALRGEFQATAARFHRNTMLAGAMVDPSIPAFSDYKTKNGMVVLTADQARREGFSDATAPTLDAALADFGVAGAPRTTADYTLAERLARIATDPNVSGILLALGFLGLLVELQTLHGIAGAIGAGALALFFGTHVYAGFSNGLVIALAVAGLVLILFELHVLPGHGIAGVLGALLLIGAVLLAFGPSYIVAALQALAIAIVLTVAGIVVLQRVIPENAFMKRIVFAGTQGPDYVASPDHRALLGAGGTAISFLRPAGVASFGDTRVDVLTEGEFVPAGTPVRVTRVEGARIFVRPDTEAEAEANSGSR
jgi:membrane-bound serine protease (ClpP class)